MKSQRKNCCFDNILIYKGCNVLFIGIVKGKVSADELEKMYANFVQFYYLILKKEETLSTN